MNLKLIIPVALIAVGAGLYGLSQNRNNGADTKVVVEPAPEVKEIKIRVWKAKSDLQPGQLVAAGDLKVDLLPEAEANELGFRENIDIDFIKNMVSGSEIEPGQIVTQSDFVLPSDEEYIDLTIQKGMVPYAIKVDPETIIGGLIKQGSLIDVIALSSTNQNLSIETDVDGYRSVSISPVLMAVKVLKVQKEELLEGVKDKKSSSDVSLIIELSRKQLARLLVAKNIAQLEVHKSVGKEQAELLKANSGDVLPSYKAIREYRSSEAKIR